METLPYKIPPIPSLISNIPGEYLTSNDRLVKAVFHDINNKINVLTLKLEDFSDTLVEEKNIPKEDDSMYEVKAMQTSVLSFHVVAEKFKKYFALEDSDDPMALVKKSVTFLRRYRAVDMAQSEITVDDEMITEGHFIKEETAALFYVLNKVIDHSVAGGNKKIQLMFESSELVIRTETDISHLF